MPRLNNKEPGDIFYPDYSRIKTLSCTDGVEKGYLYSINNDGEVKESPTSGAAVKGLIALSGGKPNFTRGVVQAMETVKAATGATAQFLCAGSRIGLKLSDTTATAHEAAHGTALTWDQANHWAEVFNTPGDGDAGDAMMQIVGRVFEIYTETDIASEKKLTAQHDVVIVELGMK